MSQEEILDFLEKNKRKSFTTAELASKIGVTRGAIRKSMVSLRKAGYVAYKEKLVHGIYKVYYSYACRLSFNNNYDSVVLKRWSK